MHIASWALQLPQGFKFTFTLPRKNEKPLTAINVPPYCITAETIIPYFGFTASTKVVAAEKQKNAYHQNITPVLHYHQKQYRYVLALPLPQENTANSRYLSMRTCGRSDTSAPAHTAAFTPAQLH